MLKIKVNLCSELQLQRPEVQLLVPAERPADSSAPLPLICRVSGLEDAGRVSVDWQVDETDGLQLRPTILSGSEAGVISVQVFVPAHTWSAGSQVSCVLTDGELSITKSASITAGEIHQQALLFKMSLRWLPVTASSCSLPGSTTNQEIKKR